MTNKTNSKIAKTLDLSIAWITLITIFLFPIFFNPLGSDLFDLAKRLLLAVSASSIMIIWTIKNILNKSVRFSVTPFTLPVLAVTAVTIASAVSTAIPESIEAVITTTSSILFLFIIFLAATTSRAAVRISHGLLNAFVASGVVLSILGILEAIGIGPSQIVNRLTPSLAADSAIFLTPAGSATILIAFLIPTLIAAVLSAFSSKGTLERALYLLSGAVIIASIAIGVFNILPGKPNSPVFLPFSTSWEIAAENIKRPKAFIIGVGAQNYVAAFSSYRPASFNLNELWNTRFSAARNYPLHVFTTTGVLGLAAWIFTLMVLLNMGKKYQSLSSTAKVALISAASVVVINLLLPPNPILSASFIFLLIVLAAEAKASKSFGASELMLKFFAANLVKSDINSEEEQKPKNSELLPIVLGVPALLLAVVFLYGAYRVGLADIYFKKSLVAVAANDGTNTYEFQRLAVSANPLLSSYHRSYASTNLAIANAIGAAEELSDADRGNITTLIQQAIREAKVAVQINPQNPTNWESLASIYRNLINVAEGATDWSTASYVEAIRRDPVNPALRLELGGIYYQLEDYQNATRLFGQAADLKPNWPNAHYNLGNAYAQNGEIQRAIASYDAVLQLIEPGSEDYQKALDEQNLLKKKLGQAPTDTKETTDKAGQLQQPSPLPSPVPAEEQIKLDESSAPPEGTGTGFSDLVEPTPTPTP